MARPDKYYYAPMDFKYPGLTCARAVPDVVPGQLGAIVVCIPQAKLSDECWTVQVWGLKACATCEYRDSPECGGLTIRKTTKNSAGHQVPIRSYRKEGRRE